MNWTKLSAALVICLATAAQAKAGLFDLFCCHDDCQPACCAPMYCEPICCEPMCCEPMCCEPVCGMPMECCAPMHCPPPCCPPRCEDDDCCLKRLFRRICDDDDDCRPACCQPMHCEPMCCEPMHCEPVCGMPMECCAPVQCCPQPCCPPRECDDECCLKRLVRKIWHCEHRKNQWCADKFDMCYPYQECGYGYGGGHCGYPVSYGCSYDMGCGY
jgi:hypothetical protein